jgi:hypothetical protein
LSRIEKNSICAPTPIVSSGVSLKARVGLISKEKTFEVTAIGDPAQFRLSGLVVNPNGALRPRPA